MTAFHRCFRLSLFVMFVSGVFATPGCNRGPSLVNVAGEVIYKGQPITDGDIIFADIKGNDPTAVGKVIDGRYKLRTTAGEKRIRITATKKSGKMLDGAMGAKYPELIDILPPPYNSASTLTRAIQPGDKATLDFKLE